LNRQQQQAWQQEQIDKLLSDGERNAQIARRVENRAREGAAAGEAEGASQHLTVEDPHQMLRGNCPTSDGPAHLTVKADHDEELPLRNLG
jgi:hypothetical protein